MFKFFDTMHFKWAKLTRYENRSYLGNYRLISIYRDWYLAKNEQV